MNLFISVILREKWYIYFILSIFFLINVMYLLLFIDEICIVKMLFNIFVIDVVI